MRVRIKTCVSGPEMLLRPGEIADLDDGVASRLVANGDAEILRGDARSSVAEQPATVVTVKKRRRKIEKATIKAPEDTRLA